MLLYQSTKKMFSFKYHIVFQSMNFAKIYCYEIQLIWCVIIDKWCSGTGRSYWLLLLCVVVIFALYIVNFCWFFSPFLCKIRRWSVTRPISNTLCLLQYTTAMHPLHIFILDFGKNLRHPRQSSTVASTFFCSSLCASFFVLFWLSHPRWLFLVVVVWRHRAVLLLLLFDCTQLFLIIMTCRATRYRTGVWW